MKIRNKVCISFMVAIFTFNFLLADDQTDKVRTFKNVNGVAILGSGDAKIVNGNKNEIVIHAPADLIPYLKTYVNDGTLIIGKRKNGWKKFRHFHNDINYDIVVKNIDHVKVTGSGNATAEKLDGDKCIIKVSGSGNIDVSNVFSTKTTIAVSGSGNIEIDNLKADILGTTISGSGDVDVNGKVDELDITISGSGNFDGNGLKTKDAAVDIYGSGDAKFACTENLEAHLTGSGDVTCYGNPSVRSRSTGSGTVITR